MAPSRLLKSLDLFFVLRPMLFFPGWSTLLVGYFIAQKGQVFFTAGQIMGLDYYRITVLMGMFAAAMGGSFLLNQVKDLATDKANEKLFFLTSGHISKQTAIAEALVLLLLALLIAGTFGLSVFAACAVFIFVTAYAYNFSPFRFKDSPVASLFANAAMGWLAFAIGWLAVKTFSAQLFMDALPYLFINTALYFYTTLPDVEGDRQSQKNTFAVTRGIKFVITAATVLMAMALLCAIALNDITALVISVLCLPLVLWAQVQKNVAGAIRAVKFSIMFFALVICFKLPFYFVLMIAIFFFTKWFFKKRFNFNYPNFEGN